MVAIAFFLGVLVIAALLGYFVYRRSSRTHPFRSILLASVVVIIVIGFSAFAFLYAIISYPPTDDSMFADRNSISIDREGKPPLERRSEVSVVFPYTVRKGSDFQVVLVISSSPPLPSGNYISELKGPESLKLRPQTNCSGLISPTAACKTVKEQKSEVTLSWDVTPTEEAEASLRLTIPEIWSDSGNWSASIKFDGKEPVIRLPTNRSVDVTPWGSSRREDQPEVKRVKLGPDKPQFRLTQSTVLEGRLSYPEGDMPYYSNWLPAYAAAGADIDLETRVVRFPIQVVTSLGLDSTTYTRLALVGVVLSGMLGTGWLWRLVELFKARREQLGSSGLNNWSTKQLREAIIDSFDYPDLQRLLADMSPSRNLDELVNRAPYREQVFELISVAAREGWIGSFLQSALDERADKPRFVAVARPIADQIAADAGTKPVPTVRTN